MRAPAPSPTPAAFANLHVNGELVGTYVNGGQACDPPPADVLLAELPQHLDIPQMLRMGAVQAYIANTDGPLFEDNNWYYYDWAGGGRMYMTTDLDTTMRDYTDVLEELDRVLVVAGPSLDAHPWPQAPPRRP